MPSSFFCQGRLFFLNGLSELFREAYIDARREEIKSTLYEVRNDIYMKIK